MSSLKVQRSEDNCPRLQEEVTNLKFQTLKAYTFESNSKLAGIIALIGKQQKCYSHCQYHH